MGRVYWNIITWRILLQLKYKDTTDADYIHAKRVRQDFKIKNLGEYHNLYLKSDTLLLTNVFKNF